MVRYPDSAAGLTVTSRLALCISRPHGAPAASEPPTPLALQDQGQFRHVAKREVMPRGRGIRCISGTIVAGTYVHRAMYALQR